MAIGKGHDWMSSSLYPTFETPEGEKLGPSLVTTLQHLPARFSEMRQKAGIDIDTSKIDSILKGFGDTLQSVTKETNKIPLVGTAGAVGAAYGLGAGVYRASHPRGPQISTFAPTTEDVKELAKDIIVRPVDPSRNRMSYDRTRHLLPVGAAWGGLGGLGLGIALHSNGGFMPHAQDIPSILGLGALGTGLGTASSWLGGKLWTKLFPNPEEVKYAKMGTSVPKQIAMSALSGGVQGGLVSGTTSAMWYPILEGLQNYYPEGQNIIRAKEWINQYWPIASTAFGAARGGMYRAVHPVPTGSDRTKAFSPSEEIPWWRRGLNAAGEQLTSAQDFMLNPAMYNVYGAGGPPEGARYLRGLDRPMDYISTFGTDAYRKLGNIGNGLVNTYKETSYQDIANWVTNKYTQAKDFLFNPSAYNVYGPGGAPEGARYLRGYEQPLDYAKTYAVDAKNYAKDLYSSIREFLLTPSAYNVYGAGGAPEGARYLRGMDQPIDYAKTYGTDALQWLQSVPGRGRDYATQLYGNLREFALNPTAYNVYGAGGAPEGARYLRGLDMPLD